MWLLCYSYSVYTSYGNKCVSDCGYGGGDYYSCYTQVIIKTLQGIHRLTGTQVVLTFLRQFVKVSPNDIY